MSSRIRTSLMGWCLSSALLATLGVGCQRATQSALPPSTPFTKTLPGPPLDSNRGESFDDSVGRQQALFEWFGGEPSAEYLAAKKALAQQEVRKWSTSFRIGKSTPLRRGGIRIPEDDETWNNIGPTGGLAKGRPEDSTETEAGRISIQGIVTHPTDARILYIATAAGGVWKTTQADPDTVDWHWTSITDNLPNATSSGNLACGALAMSPSDAQTLYLGLGDFWSTSGQGLYKTTNGGGDWTELGPIGATRRVLSVQPLTASVILVGGDAGLWRSTNGGTNFGNVAINGDTGGSIWSIQKLSATNLILNKQNRGGDADGVGTLWYSTNAGASWSQANINLPAGIQNTSIGRITLSTSPNNATVAYGLVQLIQTPYLFFFIPTRDPETFLPGLLRTDDSGQNWSSVDPAVPNPFQVWKQSSYNQALAVNPNDTNMVFAGGNTSSSRSLNGGTDWQQLTHWSGWTRAYAHADFQAAAFSKTGPLTLFAGNDGGLTVFWRPSAPFNEYPQGDGQVNPDARYVDNRHNAGIVTHNVYNIGSTTAANSRWKVSAGMQDNGTRLRRGPAPGTTLFDETSVETGDGIATLYHKSDGRKLLISSYYVNIYQSTDDGANFVNTFSSSAYLLAPFFTRLHPGLFDDSGNTVFTHTAWGIYRSDDFGGTWAWDTPSPIFAFKSIRNFNVSKSNANSRGILTGRLPSLPAGYAAGEPADQFEDVDIIVTHNAGENWIAVHNPPAGDPNHRGRLSYLWFKTDDDDTLYVAGVEFNAQEHHLFKSVNGGQDWTPIDGSPGASNGFPYGIPVHVIKNDLADTSVLLAGTDFGVYISRNGGDTWARYGDGMPLVSVMDLYLAPDGSFVRAASFGRGVWEIGQP